MKSTMLRASWGLWLGASVCLIQTLHAQIAPKLSIHLPPGYAEITVTGTVSGVYTIEATTNLALTNGWVALTNVVLPASLWVYIDYASPAVAKRFYRAVGTNTPPDTNAPVGMVLIQRKVGTGLPCPSPISSRHGAVDTTAVVSHIVRHENRNP